MIEVIANKIKDDNSCYKFFLFFKTITNILGLMRGTAFGYILFKLNISPFFLSLYFIISIFSNLICYFLFPLLHNKLKTPLKIIITFELISTFFLSLSILYLCYLYNEGTYGNYWLIVLLNLGLCVPVYGFISSSPLFAKESFPQLNYKNIIRFDFISFSFAKLVGFSLGVFIIDIRYVILFFILSFLFSIFLNFFYRYLLKTRKNITNIVEATDETKPQKDKYHSRLLTYLIVLIPSIFIVIINVQAVFLDKTYGIPFYLTPLVSAIGGLIFNIFVNKNMSLNVDNRFYLLGALLCVSFLAFAFSTSKPILIIALFLIGGIYTTLNTMCTSRLYSYSKTREPKSISTYYALVSIFTIIGTFLVGVLFEFYSVTIVFSIWALLSFLLFNVIFILNKRFNLDKIIS